MIKVVIFDLGNVILPFDVYRLANRLTKHSSYSPDEIVQKLWDHDFIGGNFETGKMSPTQYFDHISKACDFKNLTFETFVPYFNDIFHPEDQQVIEIIKDLKKKYKLGLISNINPIHGDHIRQKYTHLNHFDKHWFSHEAGHRKPDPAIYQMALTHFDVEPSHAVFIDDMELNIDGAKKLGMNAIHFKKAEQLEAELQDMGVLKTPKAA